jgi:hypothetical protein
MSRDSYLHLTIAADVTLNLTSSCTERGVTELIFTVTWTKRYNKENALYVDIENPRFYQKSKPYRIQGRNIMFRRSLNVESAIIFQKIRFETRHSLPALERRW